MNLHQHFPALMAAEYLNILGNLSLNRPCFIHATTKGGMLFWLCCPIAVICKELPTAILSAAER